MNLHYSQTDTVPEAEKDEVLLPYEFTLLSNYCPHCFDVSVSFTTL